MHISKFAIVPLLALTMGQGCLLFGENSSKNPDGGVFVSNNKGSAWTHRVSIPTITGTPGSIAVVSVRALAMDPQDHNALYIGTAEHGLFYSYDQGISWFQAKDVARGAVYGVAVDPKNKCTIYAAAGKYIVVTRDCSRTFSSVYVEPRENYVMTSIIVDPKNVDTLYAGSSSGDVLKSTDGGKSWSVGARFEDEIKQISVNPRMTSEVYVGLANKGLAKSVDKGATWLRITPDTGKFSGAGNFRAMAWDVTNSNSFFIATRYGIFKTVNGGDTWQPLKLVTAPGEITIYGLAVNPKNNKEIVYTTSTGQSSTLFVSQDAGVTWSAKKSPTRRILNRVLIDPNDPNVVIVGAFASQQ